MALASKQNGIALPNLQPWRMKISYTLTDEQGGATVRGTIDETWMDVHRGRITYTRGTESETIYVTPSGRSQTGTRDLDVDLPEMVRNEIVEPISDANFIQTHKFRSESHDMGTTKLSCLSLVPSKLPNLMSGGLAYCFSVDKPVLRITVGSSGKIQMIHNNIVLFQEKYIPKDITLMKQGKPAVTAHIESLETFKGDTDAELVLPADATQLPPTVTLSAQAAGWRLMQHTFPSYPIAAKTARISGAVELHAVIGRSGRIKSLTVTSGAQALQSAAIDAVKDWLYKPYILSGETEEVETTVKIIFNLGS